VDTVRKSDGELRKLRALVGRITEGNCVLVLGPRVAIRPNETERTPLDELLAGEILADLEDVPPAEATVAATSLRRAADLYERKGKDLDELREIARDFYLREASSTTDFHRDLAALPFRLCVSASPDSLMLTAFQQVEKVPQKAHYNFRGASRRVETPAKPLRSPAPERPIIYHLFGHYEDPSSLVLTEADLIQYLVNIVRGNPPIPDEIRSILVDPAQKFLFIGFGFQNWYLRVLLHVLGAYGHIEDAKPIAFEDPRFFDDPEHSQAVGFFSGARRIDFRPLQWEPFARQLRETYEAEAQPKAASVAAPADAPKAFLSYASEDREIVEALAEKLEAHSIRVWQDVQDLRAGDQWEKALTTVIEKQVDYVVVVQTSAMCNRIEGVFHAEINAALKRQERFGEFEGQQLRFLIPVTAGQRRMLSTLDRFHALDVSDDAGIEALASSIKEDWQRRAARMAVA
jgi:nucleotide-binding universal stress UspA family protein